MKNAKAFTLIEAVITLSILAAGIMGVLTLYQKNIAKANEMEQIFIATYLDQQKLEQIIQDKKYNLYASITTANYPSAPEDLTANGFKGYTRTTTIKEVDPADLTTAKNGSGYKRITVSVQISGGSTIILDTILTSWGEL